MTTIKLKNGSGAPLAGDLVQGEPALDLTNKRLYTEDSGGTVIEVGTNPTSLTTGGLTVDGVANFNANNINYTGSSPRINFYENDATDLNSQLINTLGDFFIRTVSDDAGTTTNRFSLDHATGDISFYDTAGTTAKFFWDSSAESLGIGTTSPSNDLHIKGAGAANIRLEQGNGSNYGLIKQNQTSQLLQLGVGGSFGINIDSANNVGIGTSSPATELHVLKSGSDADVTIEGTGTGVDARINLYANSTGVSQIRFGDEADTNIGLLTYDHSDDSMAFRTDNSEAMRIDSSGHVGIKVTPAAWRSGQDVLQVGNGALTNYSDVVTSLSHNSYIDGTGSVKYITTGQEAYQIALSSFDNAMTFKYAASGTAGNAISFSEAMRIDSSGNLLVGTTDADLGYTDGDSGFVATSEGAIQAARDSSNAILYLNKLNNNGTIIQMHKDGTIVGTISVTASSTSYNTSSDYRLKENVVPLTGATERVKQLNPSRFNFIADADTTVDGFLAHEVADVVPEAITGTKDAVDDDGNAVYQGIDQSKLVPLLVATIQELEARITALESN